VLYSISIILYQMLLVPLSPLQHTFLYNSLKVIHFQSFTHHITFNLKNNYMFKPIYHQVFKITVEETAVLLLAWLQLLIPLMYVPLCTHAYSE
jgi:hypothetical protein